MLSVQLLGERRLLSEGRDIGAEVQYRKAWALLGYLAVESGRRHPREHLAGLFWPALPPLAARTNLRQVVANLNRVFEAHGASNLLQSSRDDVGFYPQPKVLLDVHEVEGAAEASDADLLRLEATLANAGGEFLGGLQLEDCPAFEQWLQPVRARLAASTARALRRLLDAQQTAGFVRRALATAKRLVDLDPWDESVLRQWMTLLAIGGQFAEALQVYERLVETLRVDLDSAPTASTVALHEAIRAAVESGLPFAPTPAASTRTRTRHWACGIVCRVDPMRADADTLLPQVIAYLEVAGARPLFANRDTAYASVVAEGEPSNLNAAAARAARMAAAAVQTFAGRLGVVLCPALVQSQAPAGLALVGNAGEWATHLLPQARADLVLVCESLFENLFETFALHPHGEVALPDAARPLRVWRLGADGVSTSSELAEKALAEAARPTGALRPKDAGFTPDLLTLRLDEAPPDEGLAATAWLTVVAGADRGKRVGVGEAPVVIGRASDSDLQLPRRTVSRYHCVVWREAEHYRIRDLGATNRTMVNGTTVRDARLAEGDRVTVGECILHFVREP